MSSRELSRFALCACVATAVLVGCGGRASNGVVPISGAPDSLPNHRPFYYTGRAQYFTVPAGVTQISVVARCAKGAGKPIADGGRVHAVIPVTPRERLAVLVGGDASGTTGGFNGGSTKPYGTTPFHAVSDMHAPCAMASDRCFTVVSGRRGLG
jgi:hypothetical protein